MRRPVLLAVLLALLSAPAIPTVASEAPQPPKANLDDLLGIDADFLLEKSLRSVGLEHENQELRQEVYLEAYRDELGEVRADLWHEGMLATDELDISSTWPLIDGVTGKVLGDPGALPAAAASAALAPVTGVQWTQIGPAPLRIDDKAPFGDNYTFQGDGPDSGEVLDIAIDPRGSSDQVVYIATNNGGIWKTTDGGGSWEPKSDQEASLSMGAVELDPSNPDIVYAGTGNGFDGGCFFTKGAGILKSTNGGDTWTNLAGDLFNNVMIHRIRVLNNGTMLVASGAGLYRSVDGGVSFGDNAPDFDDGDPVLGGNVTDLDVDTASATTVYAGVANGGRCPGANGGTVGVFRTTDSGQSWTNLMTAANGGLISAATRYMAFAQGTDNAQVMYASAGGAGSSYLGMVRSTDGGANWNNVAGAVGAAADNGGCQCSYDHVLAVDPLDSNDVYLGFQELYGSTDAGANFNPGSPLGFREIHWDHHALTFSPASHVAPAATSTPLWDGHDGGVSRTTNAGASWTNLNEGIATNLFKEIDMGRGAGNNGFTYGGAQDTGTSQGRPGYPGADWHLGIDGDGLSVAVDPANANHTLTIDNGRLFLTNDGGDNWTGPQAFPGNTVGLLHWDLSDNDNVWAAGPSGGFGSGPNLMRSTDNGGTFTLVATLPSTIRWIDVERGDSNTVWLGLANGRVFRSTNALAGSPTFTAVTDPGPTRPIGGLAIDPDDGDHVVVTYLGFANQPAGQRQRHVYQTTDGGTTWTDISGTDGGTENLPDLPTNSVVIDSDTTPASIIVSNDAGVLRTLDNGATWQRLGAGLPKTDAVTLVLDDTVDPPILRIGTYGRSVFQLTPATGPIMEIEGDLNFGEVAVGTSETRSLTVRNIGSADLHVTNWFRSTGSVEFTADPPTAATIPPGGSASLTARFTPTAPEGPRVATFQIDSDDQFEQHKVIPATGEAVFRADMELVSKADSDDPAFAGESLTYTIRARNNGPSPATNARVTDVLPSGTTYQSSSIPCTELPPGTLTCGLGDLASGEERIFTITVGIARDLVHNNGAPLTITNTATASSDVEDPVPGNETKTEDTLVKAKADLEIVSFDPVNPPAELTIGEPQNVTLRKVITNTGPSAPMDTRVVRGAGSTANATVTPSFTSHEEEALGYQEERDVDEVFEVACIAPGPATFVFANEISPDRPDDIDPDLSNNEAMTSFSVECIVPVAINIHPGSKKNPINLGSRGVIPVAVLTTLAGEYDLPLDFDATTIQALTARFGPEPLVISGGGAHEAHDTGHIEDSIERSDEETRDGDLDMVLHFRTKESGLTGLEIEACVRGRFGPMDYVFHGCDTLVFVP